MATNHTANYELSQWLSTDQVLRTDFNADNAKLDAALAGKAEAETMSALQTAVASKAAQTALDLLETRIHMSTTTSVEWPFLERLWRS